MKESFALAAFRFLNVIIVWLMFAVATPALAADLELLMFEEDGCIWCARWEREIGPIWPKTEEAAAAPLSKLNINDPVPKEISLVRPAVFTPTFVLLADGQEVGRIEGYPGEDFFWGLLAELIETARETGS